MTTFKVLQCFSVTVLQCYAAPLHVISYTPVRNVRPFLRCFSRTSPNGQQHYVQISYTDRYLTPTDILHRPISYADRYLTPTDNLHRPISYTDRYPNRTTDVDSTYRNSSMPHSEQVSFPGVDFQ
jgi:hypothetical protein